MSDTIEKPKLKLDTGPFKNIVILGHTSVEERDKEAGKVGSTLEDADYSDAYRDTLPTIHDKATKKIVEMSGIPVGTNASATAKKQATENAAATKAGRTPKTVTDVPENFVPYATRVQKTLGEDSDQWKAIDEYFRSVALATPVDASPSARQGKVSAANLEKAKEILSRETDAVESAVEKLLLKVPTFDLERDPEGKPTEDSLARLWGSYVNVRAKETAQEV